MPLPSRNLYNITFRRRRFISLEEEMYSRIFGPKEDDDYDEIFDLDAIDTQPEDYSTVLNNLHANSNEIALQTPRSDSAIWTESQMTKITTVSDQLPPERITGGHAGYFRPSMNRESDNMFLSTQEEMDVTLDAWLNNNVHHFSNDNFVNSVNRQLATSNVPLYDLTQRTVMLESLERPSSSIQRALLTPTIGTSLTQSLRFSNGPDIWSQEIPVGSNDDFCLRHDETQHGTQSQEQHFSAILSNHDRLNDISNTFSIPESVFELYKQIKSTDLSDWSFVYALSAQTCQEFMPMNYNINLKTSLLLSIASINTKSDSAPIPIIAFGQDSSSANSIMNYMGNFAQRFLAPTDHIFNVTINSDKRVEIGPVFLAKNGVCYLGDWSGLSKKNSDEIKIVIDSGRYFLNQTSENFPLGSALWAYWSSTQKNRKDFTNVAIFIKYFGIPIMTDTNESDDIIEFILTEAKDGTVELPNDILNIRNEDMKNYLNIVRKINVRKTDEAQKLLKLYSDTIQVDREGLLSPKGLQIIQQMAESFAKLSLRDLVLVCDVVGAISIAENTFYVITGSARAPLLPSTQDIVMVDQYIQAFHKWVFNYVGLL